jgi:acylphosphatase
MTTKRYIVHGIVQGVGYRYYVYRVAQELGLSGWVSNSPMGTVEVLAGGSVEQLEKLEAMLRKGPFGSHVEHLEMTDENEETSGQFRVVM